MFIEGPLCFDGPRGFHQPVTLGRSDLGLATKKNKCTSGCYERRGSFGQVGVFIAPAGTLGRQRAVGAKVEASGTTRGPGSIHRLGLSLVRITGLFDRRARLDRRAGYHRHRVQRSVAAAPLCGLFETSWPSRAFSFGAGSFERPSNKALQPSSGAEASE